MMRVNINLYPKDSGYEFLELDGSRHLGSSWSEVIARVIAYRKRQGRDAGNAEAEVHAQACQRNPTLCINQNDAAIQLTKHFEKKISVKGKVLQWFAELIRRKQANDLRFVSMEEQKSREAICASCPKNVEYPSGCASCKVVIKEYRRSILGNRVCSNRLNACAILGEDTATSVCLDEHRINSPELPSNCWRKSGI